MKLSIFLLTVCLFFSASLHAQNSAESPFTPDEAKAKIEAILNKLDTGNFKQEEKTIGFIYLITNRWYSPFNYNFFIQTVTSKNLRTVVRVEGPRGDRLMFARILELEKVIDRDSTPVTKKEPSPLSPKYHAIAQPLNFISPALGVMYVSYKSPRLSRTQTWTRIILYLLTDAILVRTAGSGGFRERYRPEKYSGAIVAALLVPRIIGSVSAAELVTGHNRVMELGYTFYLE